MQTIKEFLEAILLIAAVWSATIACLYVYNGLFPFRFFKLLAIFA